MNSVLVIKEDEDDAYEEFLEEEVLNYGLSVARASGDPGHWKMENAEHYNITMHFRRTIQRTTTSRTTRCNDKVTEQLVSDTFYKVDKAV